MVECGRVVRLLRRWWITGLNRVSAFVESTADAGVTRNRITTDCSHCLGCWLDPIEYRANSVGKPALARRLPARRTVLGSRGVGRFLQGLAVNEENGIRLGFTALDGHARLQFSEPGV